MTEEEILDELLSQRDWWEKQLETCQKELDNYKKELFKVNRLIELLQLKIQEDSV